MARARTSKLQCEQLRGIKYLRQITSLLRRLHGDATARDKAGDRKLFYDQYAALVLLAMFSPAIDSLRGIQQGQRDAQGPQAAGLLACEPGQPL